MPRDHFEEKEDLESEEITKEQLEVQEAILQNKRNYIACFDNHPGKQVLKDLDNYCRLSESTFTTDQLQMAYLNGVRDAGLYIKNMAKIDTPAKPTDKE